MTMLPPSCHVAYKYLDLFRWICSCEGANHSLQTFLNYRQLPFLPTLSSAKCKHKRTQLHHISGHSYSFAHMQSHTLHTYILHQHLCIFWIFPIVITIWVFTVNILIIFIALTILIFI